MNLNSAQLSAQSEQFLNLVKAIESYRENHQLSITEEQQLKKIQDALCDVGEKMANLSAIQVGAEDASALEELSGVTDHILKTVQNISNVQKIIDITAAALKLALSLTTSSPKNIASSLGELKSACNFKK